MGSSGLGSGLPVEGQLKARWKASATQKVMMLLKGSHANFRKRRAGPWASEGGWGWEVRRGCRK
jgi:hypothetical protein